MTTHDPTSTQVDAVQCGERVVGNAIAARERGLPCWFDVPLYSHIIDNLYVGGAPETPEGHADLLRLAPDVIFNMAPWFYYPVPAKSEIHKYEFYDSKDQDLSEVSSIAAVVAQRLARGDKVLVHCQAGLNRSNLVAARALIFWKNMTAHDAVDLLRAKRCSLVLCNKHFEDWLYGLDGKNWPCGDDV